jgi:DNA primase
VIAFTARTLETGDKAGAKYINSPETPLYSKSLVLFNLDKARSSIRQHEFALLVEGQMDCISVYLRGIQNVIATSGTAFTEQQVAILKRHTAKPGSKPQIVANFDPDEAGKSAAAKTIALLTEENFSIKIVILDDGLDPDRYIRERGVEAYIRAVRGARRLDDFLIDRARQMFPGVSGEQKVKQMNYLLPYIRRLPEMQERSQFEADAAQKLGIDSAALRNKLHQAALRRQDHIETQSTNPADRPSFAPSSVSSLLGNDRERARSLSISASAAIKEGVRNVQPQGTSKLTGVEKILLRALAIDDPEFARSRELARRALEEQPAWFEHLGAFAALQALAARQAHDPMDVVADEAQRALLAEALLAETKPPEEGEVESAIQEIQERAIESRLRELRAEIAEAERRGDSVGLAVLTQQKLEMDRALRQLHNQRQPQR